MGYCVTMTINGVVIPRAKIVPCLKAINALHDPKLMKKQAGGGSSTGEKWYSWVHNPPQGAGYYNLETAFRSWRYHAYRDEKGRMVLDHFTGEKWGDDEVLYSTIAPFVHRRIPGTIEIVGEDGDRWRYLFEDGKATEQKAATEWVND